MRQPFLTNRWQSFSGFKQKKSLETNQALFEYEIQRVNIVRQAGRSETRRCFLRFQSGGDPLFDLTYSIKSLFSIFLARSSWNNPLRDGQSSIFCLFKYSENQLKANWKPTENRLKTNWILIKQSSAPIQFDEAVRKNTNCSELSKFLL